LRVQRGRKRWPRRPPDDSPRWIQRRYASPGVWLVWRQRRGTNQDGSDPGRNDVRLVLDVGSSETQHAETGIEEQVLTAIVFDESIPMVISVVLNDEPRPGVVKVGSAQEATVGVMKVALDLWVRQPRQSEEPAKPSFHRRFSGFRESGQRT